MNNTFRAFRNRNFALFFAGQSVSQIGTWMQRTAVSWVVYSITKSDAMLGLAMFAQLFPSFLLSLFGGIVADRHSRYKILLVTQTASMIQAILLAVLILTNHYVIWEILTLGVLLGIINAFDVPARQPMVLEMIANKEDIPNAVALNSAMVNIARLVGPAMSGIVLNKLGAGICFSLNALSFVAVIGSLLLMRLPAFVPPIVKKNVAVELAEGFAYLKQTPAISIVILMIIALGLLVLPYDTIIPVFAKVVFRGDAATFGYLTSFMGAGAVLGSVFLATVKKDYHLKILLLASTLILGTGLIVFSLLHSFPVALGVALVVGFGSLMPATISITIIQMESATNMRGRVMSYVAMAYFGMLPLGSLLVGAVSQRFTAPVAMRCQGIAALVIVAVFARYLLKRKVHAPVAA